MEKQYVIAYNFVVVGHVCFKSCTMIDVKRKCIFEISLHTYTLLCAEAPAFS